MFGDFDRSQVSVEWHDFRLDKTLAWERSFHPRSLELCLNFSGTADIRHGEGGVRLEPGEWAAYLTGSGACCCKAERNAGCIHRFITVELGPDWLKEHLGPVAVSLDERVRAFMDGGVSEARWLGSGRIPAGLLPFRMQLLDPPVRPAAYPTWYRGKILDLLAHVLFADPGGELFCESHKRQRAERIEQVCHLLERDLENPPSLDMLAEAVDWSPSHLSRTFVREMGMSVPKYLRIRRVERAAALLKEGSSVTDAAFAVGYSSLSAFNKAFHEHMKCCPGLYPLRRK